MLELVGEVTQDMNELQEEMNLLLIAACMYDHANKQKLLQVLKMLRGQPDTGFALVETPAIPNSRHNT